MNAKTAYQATISLIITAETKKGAGEILQQIWDSTELTDDVKEVNELSINELDRRNIPARPDYKAEGGTMYDFKTKN